MSQLKPQNLPASPPSTSNFNLTYFFQQWAAIAQVINNNATSLTQLIASVAGIKPFVPPTPTQTILARALATVYQNTDTTTRTVLQTFGFPGNSGGTLTIKTDASNPPTSVIGTPSAVAANSSPASAAVTFLVLPGNFYEMTRDVNITLGITTEWN